MIVSIIAAMVGGVAAGLVVNTSKRRAVKNKTSGEMNQQGYMIMNGRSNNKVVTYCTFIFGVGAMGFSIPFITSDIENALMGVLLGIFFIALSFLLNKMTNDNRIEYDNYEIRQYRIFRKKPDVVKWSDIKKIDIKNIGPLLVLNDNIKDIFIDFRFDGIIPFIKFAIGKVDNKNEKILSELLSNLNRN